MDWMLTHQLSSKNLSVNERMAMVDDFKEEVKLDNEKKKKETEGRPSKNCTPIGVQNTNATTPRIHSETWTDSQVAKKAGVGVGTVARYNKVMNSNDEDLKEKVKTGQVTVNKAYEEVRKRETRVRRNMCEAEKIYANDKVSIRRIKEENERKKSIAVAESNRKRNSNGVHLDATDIINNNNQKSGCVQMNISRKVQQRDRTTNTREQRAKLSGVSAGTVARYDTVMNSDNKEVQQHYCLAM